MLSPADASPSILLLLFLPTTTSLSLNLLLLLLAAFLFSPGGIAWSRRSHIPGPSSLSASLALSSTTTHRALSALSSSLAANRLMTFSLGFSHFVISSHPETAKEILNSSAFADRPMKESARELFFHRAMGFAPFGEYWRRRRVNGIGDDIGVVGDFVDVLLDLEKEEKLSDSDMVAILWEMIFRGTDTVAILLEWIMARMVLHPDIQAKAQTEIDAYVGKSRLVSDADIPNLHYLQSIVKECLRMHPPGPLLSWAHLAIHDVHVGTHFIPAGTTAMVNVWAITHDESIWTDPDEFKPERFLTDDVSIMGSDLRLAPFGYGRRVCPGKAMGLATVHLWLAQLLQSFMWKSSNSKVDLSECLKMSLEMKNHLVCCSSS